LNRSLFIKLTTSFIIGTGLDSLLNPVTEKSINKISQFVNEDQKNGHLLKIDISDHSTEGGEILCYYKNDIIQKIEIVQCWESGKTESEVFFKYGQIIKATKKNHHYNLPFYIGKKKADDYGIKGHFDPKKTIIDNYELFYSRGRIFKAYRNGEVENDFNSLEKYLEKYYQKSKIILSNKERLAEN